MIGNLVKDTVKGLVRDSDLRLTRITIDIHRKKGDCVGNFDKVNRRETCCSCFKIDEIAGDLFFRYKINGD